MAGYTRIEMTAEKIAIIQAKELLTIREAAAYMNVHPMTVNHWVKDGKLVGIKVGARVRFRKMDIDAFINRSPLSTDRAMNNAVRIAAKTGIKVRNN